MYFVIGADFVPTDSNRKLFESGDAQELIGSELKEILDDAEYRIFNLEIPLTDKKDPITKHGPNLIAPTATIKGYESAGVDLFTLANNHILDQNAQGLDSTIKALEKAGIAHVGAGESLAEAQKPYVFDFAGRKVGVYACVEHEFSVATEETPGANPFDPLWSLDHVAELKENSDFVIVLYHGGKEHYRYPSPNLQKTCRRLIDKGADLVLCQHSHCIGGEEKYGNGTIVYGQGNFLFDLQNNEFWKTGLLVKVDDSFNVSYIPVQKADNVVRIVDEEKAAVVLKGFAVRSEHLKDPKYVADKYSEYALRSLPEYLNWTKGRESVFYKISNKISGNKLREITVGRKYDSRYLSSLWNFIDCEAHRELFLQGIKKTMEKRKK